LNLKGGREVDILKALKKANVITPKNASIPILGCVLLQSQQEELYITAADLESGIKVKVNDPLIKSDISCAVDGKVLYGFLSSLKKCDFDFQQQETSLLVKSLDTELELPIMSADKFPEFPEPEVSGFVVPCNKFKQALKRTYFISQAGLREYGVDILPSLLECKDGEFRVVTSDDTRLALAVVGEGGSELSACVSRDTLVNIDNILPEEGNVEVKIGKNIIFFIYDDIIFFSRLVNKEFPPYSQVVSAHDKATSIIEIKASELLETLSRASLVLEAAKLIIDKDKVTVTHNSRKGKFKETVVPKSITGNNMTVIFDIKFLMEPLKTLDDELVTIHIIDKNNPITLLANNYTYVIMPLVGDELD